MPNNKKKNPNKNSMCINVIIILDAFKFLLFIASYTPAIKPIKLQSGVSIKIKNIDRLELLARPFIKKTDNIALAKHMLNISFPNDIFLGVG